MRRTLTLIAGVAGLLLWGFLVVTAGQSFREDPVDYDMQDLDVPDPPQNSTCRMSVLRLRSRHRPDRDG